MQKPKLIVIWDEEDILSSYIGLYLAAREDWKVVRVSSKEELEALIPLIEKAKADVVIIHQRCHNDSFKFQLDFIRDQPTFKVITINLENNAMEVYSKQKIMVQQASDLIAAIENQH